MKIGIYDPYLDTLGGGEKYMLAAASCLSDKHEVRVFWDEASILQQAHQRFNLNFDRVKLVPNIFSPEIPVLKRLVVSARYDVIFFLSDGSIPLTLACKTFLHFQFPVEWVDGKKLATRVKFLKIAGVICNSYFTKKFIDNKFGVNSKVLYPPCGDMNLKHDYAEKKENMILTVGRYNAISPEVSFKKHEIMLEVWKKMVDSGLKDWKFTIVTSYLEENKKYVDQLEKQVESYPINIIRNASFATVTQLYKKAKIYWHATGFGEDLTNHPERAEHFGIVTVEAMGYGLVPVVIDAGGQTEIVNQGENGFLWKTKDELMEFTQKLIRDKALLESLAKAAKKKADKFSSENFCSSLNRLILAS